MKMPNGEEKWLGGALTDEQKMFVSMEINMPEEDAVALFSQPTVLNIWDGEIGIVPG